MTADAHMAIMLAWPLEPAIPIFPRLVNKAAAPPPTAGRVGASGCPLIRPSGVVVEVRRRSRRECLAPEQASGEAVDTSRAGRPFGVHAGW